MSGRSTNWPPGSQFAMRSRVSYAAAAPTAVSVLCSSLTCRPGSCERAPPLAKPERTVYAICDGRGFNDSAAVLGPDFASVLVRDRVGSVSRLQVRAE